MYRARPIALSGRRDRFPHRRDSFRRRGLHRHERLGARQRANGPGGDRVARGRPRNRVQIGRRDGDAGRRPRADRRRGLLLGPHRRHGQAALRSHRDRFAGRARLRRLADLDLRASRRRHLHQGRRRRRGSGGQGRGGNSRGRSAQSRHDRRQCRRQRRRLRGHGGGPVRDLRGDGRGDHGAGFDLLRGNPYPGKRDDLSAGDLRRLHHHVDRRHVLRQARRQQFDHGRAL